MLERYLIRHCSPTLASLKTANLFNMSFSSQEDFHLQLECVPRSERRLPAGASRQDEQRTRLCLSQITPEGRTGEERHG